MQILSPEHRSNTLPETNSGAGIKQSKFSKLAPVQEPLVMLWACHIEGTGSALLVSTS